MLFSQVICPCRHECCYQTGWIGGPWWWVCDYGQCDCHDNDEEPDPPWDAYGLTYDDLFGD